MKIFIEDKTIIQILDSNKSVNFDLKEIKNIYIIIDKTFFYRRYSLIVVTKNEAINTFYFDKRYKEGVKKVVCEVKDNIFFNNF